MAIPCVTVTVTAVPANIVATDITVTTNTCTEPCGVTVTIIWANNGGTAGTFAPSIKVDGTTPAGLPLPDVTLSPSQTLEQTFDVIGLTEGTHSICPDPNP